MENILITGGSGYIGSHIALELLKNKFKVFVIDNLSNSTKSSVINVEKIAKKKISFYKGDIRDLNFLDNFFQNHSIQCVIHCAGLKSVSESILKPLDYYQNNIEGTINLLNVVSKYKINKFLFSSSATVYDQNQEMPVKESSKIGFGQNPYARTKIFIENILRDLNLSSDLSIIILRYFNPVGNDPSYLIGEDPLDKPNNLMPLINMAAHNLSKLVIFGSDYTTRDGTPIRDYIHVSDLASGHVKALNKILDNKSQYFKIYNLGTGNGTTVLELVRKFEIANSISVPYCIGNRRLGDIESSFADNSLALKELKWKPLYNLEDMCMHSYNWYKKLFIE